MGSRVLLVLLAGLASGPLHAGPEAGTELVERGRYLVQAGGCVTCHTADEPGAVPLAGGRAIASPYGTFWSPNITPDRETGIGNFTVEDVVRALKSGIAPDGQPYYPAFPYPSYGGMTTADAEAIGAYLLSLEPVRTPRRDHELPWYLASRLVMHAWNFINLRLGNFSLGTFNPDPARDAAWNRGAYLVRHLGHCGECHTPRNWLGAPDPDRELAGAVTADERIPNITPHREDGIGRWTREDLALFLEIGMLPDGDFAGSSMGAVIDANTARLSPADRDAIATYLLSLPAIPAP